MITEERAAATAGVDRVVHVVVPAAVPRAAGRRDPQAVTALLAVLTVGLGSLLAIVGLWWAA
jgi:hypothetical protein